MWVDCYGRNNNNSICTNIYSTNNKELVEIMKYPPIKDLKSFIFEAKEIRELYGGVYSPYFCSEYVVGWRDYVYSRTNIKKYHRELIWEYLNYDIEEDILIFEYIRNKNKKSKKKK